MREPGHNAVTTGHMCQHRGQVTTAGDSWEERPEIGVYDKEAKFRNLRTLSVPPGNRDSPGRTANKNMALRKEPRHKEVTWPSIFPDPWPWQIYKGPRPRRLHT